jgi:tetratricopeptide (TPR) repeat protein
MRIDSNLLGIIIFHSFEQKSNQMEQTKSAAQLTDDLINKALHFFRIHNRGEAQKCLRSAIDSALKIDTAKEKRERLMYCVHFCKQAGFLDFALEASQAAVKIDYANKDGSKDLQNDLIDYGNIHLDLGNYQKAIEAFNKSLEICLGQNDYANAASTSTNIGIVFETAGDHAKAFDCFEKSLEYLKKEPFEETELNTLSAWLMVCNDQNVPPGLIMERAARLTELMSRSDSPVLPQMKAGLKPYLMTAIKKHLKGKKEAELKAFATANFPWL